MFYIVQDFNIMNYFLLLFFNQNKFQLFLQML